jgi:sterol desaturase/sphingolipid hydroxylase (fatty acid hydroxylase superfamily)
MWSVSEVAGWVGLLSLPAFVLWDRLFPHRRFEAPRGWKLRAVVVSAASFLLSMKVGELWVALFEGSSLLDGAELGTWGGAVVGVLVYELAHYWYHRAAHRFDWLWRATHQMHHSAESLEALGAYYLHPLDAALFSTWGALVFFPLLGLDPVAAAVASAFLALNAVFQHANIRTPRWLGYLVQRPESHGIHHERGVHRYNYADLPLWDIVFGTFRNPRRWDGEAGFYTGASSRVAAMLAGRDVASPPAPEPPAALPVRPAA